ncbi:mucoidy inhibitor MuiA family protein [Psychrobacter sp. 1Y11]|uniref:mucoidy inhibitor MuiA family protein n=1 Tax=Psychrobacter sp. 1Y11 TaxID=3457446 RepID=UPI003FD4DE38
MKIYQSNRAMLTQQRLGTIPSSVFVLTALGFLLHPISAQAAESGIEQITIYQGLASVTRTLPIAGSGEQTLVFSCLSPYLDQDSLSVQALGDVNVGEVSIETLSGEQAQLCQYQGDAKVKTQQNNLASIKADLDAARLAKAYLQNMTKVSQISIEGTLASNARELETQAAAINKRILEIEQQQARAQDALNQLIAGSSTTTQNSVTQVSVRTASRTPNTLKLHYQVRGASWQPTYQARLNTDNKQLSITASAIIAQQTGENWQNVPLILSSVNPNQNATGQLPYVQRLSLYDEQQQAKVARYAQPMMEAPVVVVSADESAGAMANMAPLPSFAVSQQNKNGITEYRLPQRISIPSDGRHVRTVIDEQAGTSKLWIRSTPSAELAGYWYASAPFLTPAWVDGSLQLYRDDNYIGRTRYSYQLLKEQGIGFGIDNNMLVKQLVDEDKQGEKGAFNRTQTLTKTEAYQFTNKHNKTVNLKVLGSEPISRDDNLKVTVTHTPPVSVHDWNSNQGVVAWDFNLAPQQSQVLQTTSQVSYPANKELVKN